MTALEMPVAERDAAPLRPRAHWVRVPDERGRARLTMVWAVPDPLPESASPQRSNAR